jgi:hypothetical protein
MADERHGIAKRQHPDRLVIVVLVGWLRFLPEGRENRGISKIEDEDAHDKLRDGPGEAAAIIGKHPIEEHGEAIDRPLCLTIEENATICPNRQSPERKTMDEAKKDLPAHHYPARRSTQGKRQVPREATEKAADGQGLPAEKPTTEPRKLLSRVAQGLLLPPAR